MWCVIPVAGRSSRLRELTEGKPKSLLRIKGRSILLRLLEQLPPAITDVCLIVPEDGEAIRSEVGREQHGIRVHYAVQPRPTGVADAIAKAREHVQGSFLVVMGDVFYGDALAPYLAAWEESGAYGAVLVEPASDNQDRMGLVRVEAGKVVGIEKAHFDGQAEFRVCGMAVLPYRAVELSGEVSPGDTGEAELEGVITRLIQEGAEFTAVTFNGWRRNINTPDDVLQVEKHLEKARQLVRSR